MRLTRTFALLSCLIGLTGCQGPTQFTSSLSDPGTASVDARLQGRWYGRADASRNEFSLDGLMSVRPEGNDRMRIELSLRMGQRILLLAAHASEVDGQVYYNVIADPASYFRTFLSADEPPRYWLFRIEFAGDDKLFLWTIFRPVKEAAQHPASKRTRTVRLATASDYDLLEASREELRTLIRDVGHERFLNTRLGPFFRLREPAEEVQAIFWLVDGRSACLVGSERASGDSVSWSGECRKGKASGNGIADWKIDGRSVESFEGTMVEGLAHGAGHCVRGDAAERKPCRYANGTRLDDAPATAAPAQ